MKPKQFHQNKKLPESPTEASKMKKKRKGIPMRSPTLESDNIRGVVFRFNFHSNNPYCATIVKNPEDYPDSAITLTPSALPPRPITNYIDRGKEMRRQREEESAKKKRKINKKQKPRKPNPKLNKRVLAKKEMITQSNVRKSVRIAQKK
jgi:hypothetical protein